MALPTRNLDDRTFQDIVDEAKKRIAASCPAWTDHNVSDPGITLVELFAWMTEMILYRLNQVPEKNYIKFMELLGLKLREPEPARTAVTFYLSSALPHDITLPLRTEVSTVRTETQSALTFSTDNELVIQPPRLIALLTREMSSQGGGPASLVKHRLQGLGFGEPFEAFGSTPQFDNALYLGFENDLSHLVLALEITCQSAAAMGIRPEDPPWIWEVYAGGTGETRWLPAVVESDQSGGMDRTGLIRLRLPHMAQREMSDYRSYWLRCRVVPHPEGRHYKKSPRINNIVASSWGGTVPATHASVVRNEMLGTSDGSPGQIFYLEHTPLLRRIDGETLEVRSPGEEIWQAWKEVPDFSDSKSIDTHFTCDSTTGEVHTGPALRQPDGSVQAFGALLPRGAQVRFSAYRYGGGVVGNVQAGRLMVLKTSIPYVADVTNHVDATGGLDAETIELAQLRAPQVVRSCGRAVTASDYETLAQQADSRVQRARCLQPASGGGVSSGKITLLLVPRVTHPEQRIRPEQLHIDDELRQSVLSFLDDYRLLTVRLEIHEPEYIGVLAEVTAVASPQADRDRVRAEIEDRLYRFINPIVGGPHGDGWPFGRTLYISDVYGCLQNVPGLECLEALRLYAGQPAEKPVDSRLSIAANGLIVSLQHRVTMK